MFTHVTFSGALKIPNYSVVSDTLDYIHEIMTGPH